MTLYERRKYDRALAKELYAKRRSDPEDDRQYAWLEKVKLDRKMQQGFCISP